MLGLGSSRARPGEDWLLVGHALAIGREQAKQQAKTNKARGKAYSTQFHHWLQLNEFEDLGKSDRAHLLKIMDALPRLEEWREILTPAQRASWNHPHTVWRAFTCPTRGYAAKVNQQIVIPRPPAKPTEQEGEAVGQHGVGHWIVEANKSVGRARDFREFSGEVTEALMTAIREASDAWALTLDDFSERLRNQTESLQTAAPTKVETSAAAPAVKQAA
jgi:hypothetical protein